jgi:hypothetical protein
MSTPKPDEPSQVALRSLIRRFVVIVVASAVVIAAFVVAWRLGAFTPTRPGH